MFQKYWVGLVTLSCQNKCHGSIYEKQTGQKRFCDEPRNRVSRPRLILLLVLLLASGLHPEWKRCLKSLLERCDLQQLSLTHNDFHLSYLFSSLSSFVTSFCLSICHNSVAPSNFISFNSFIACVSSSYIFLVFLGRWKFQL